MYVLKCFTIKFNKIEMEVILSNTIRLFYFRSKVLVVIFALIGFVNPSDLSFYEILGITKQSSTQEIRQAYKKLAIKFHPDKNQVSLHEQLLKFCETYLIIT